MLNVTKFTGSAFRGIIKAKLNEVIRVGPNPIGPVSLQKEEETPEISLFLYTCMEKRSCEETSVQLGF